jgi:hypothetical protein
MRKFLLAIMLLLLPVAILADTHVASTCSDWDVMTAINASSNGDTVSVPAGNCTWDGVPAVVIQKEIVLQGAGVGSTNITISANSAFYASSDNFRITGFTITSDENFGIQEGGLVEVRNPATGWRIDSNQFEPLSDTNVYDGATSILVTTNASGLIDNNTFTNHVSQRTISSLGYHSGITIWPSGGSPRGVTRWGYTSQLNNDQYTIFIEDNDFYSYKQFSSHNPHAVYTAYGAIHVFRHNTLTNVNFDAHGYENTVGTKEYEISNNTWVVETNHNLDTIILLRGGTGVVYNNTVTHQGNANWNYFTYMLETRVNGKRAAPTRPELYGGVNTQTCCADEEGYPCVDQVGRSQSTGTSPNKSQASDPVYFWGNTFSKAANVTNTPTARNTTWVSGCDDDISDFIQSGRDFKVDVGAKPGYVPYEYPHPLTLGNDQTPPVRYNSTPGSLPSGTTQYNVELTTTDDSGGANCRIGTVPLVAYSDMTNDFDTTGGTSHSELVTGLSDGNTYNYYVRCQDLADPPNANPDDYLISFTVQNPSVGGGSFSGSFTFQ